MTIISLHKHDLAECITQKTKDEEQLQEYQLPDAFKPEKDSFGLIYLSNECVQHLDR